MDNHIEQINLGVIGFSPGNGHPYSWSAIFNGYNAEAMAESGFKTIIDYLALRTFPRDAIQHARVSHVWTQDKSISSNISRATLIENVVDDYVDMIPQVDALLLARDDAETHIEYAKPFLQAGIPVFIDKPVVLTMNELDSLYQYEQYQGQIFTCSAMRYAEELKVSSQQLKDIGNIKHIIATTPKSWEKYAVHIIEPVLLLLGDQGEIEQTNVQVINDSRILNVTWSSGCHVSFMALGKSASPISITIIGENNSISVQFQDAFSAFKQSLQAFISVVKTRHNPIDPSFVRKVVSLIEAGLVVTGTTS